MLEERCPWCAAAVRPGAPWCTQCFAPAGAAPDERPRAQVPDQPVPALVSTVPAPGPPDGEAPARPVTDASWPCDACGARTPLAETVCGTCGTAFLAGARGARPTLVLPLVGEVGSLSRVRLAAVTTTLLLALLLAGLVGGALLG